MFNKESGLVSVFVNLIQNGVYTLDETSKTLKQVPKLSNLREVITEVINATSPKTINTEI